MDYGHKATDDELKKLEQRISREYQQAYKEISEKCDKYFKSFEAKDAKMLEKVANGLMSEQDYKTWRYNQTMTGEKWVALKNSIASDMVQTDEMAMALVNNTLPDIYALNYNFGTYEIEKGLNASTSFTLVDRDTVQRMMSDNPDIFPKPTLNKIKDGIWNRQHITSAVAQGILQGESMQGIAKRLLSVTNMDKVAAIRNARTYTTSAENGGRMDSYRRAEDMGIKMRKMWISTQDERTRESHRELDRIVVDTEEEFPNKLMYPADPSGDPSEVYNCRCTMVAVLKGHEYKDVDYRDKADYEKWKAEKEKQKSDSKPKDKAEPLHGDQQAYDRVMKDIERNNVKENPVQELNESITEKELIDKLGGADQTKGSCASLAMSYVANKQGLDVTDYRGGKSQYVFSRNYNIAQILKVANADAVDYTVLREASEVAEIIKGIPKDVEYMLRTGCHASIIRNVEEGLQYLELQSSRNGWKSFGEGKKIEETLRNRFGCMKNLQKNQWTGKPVEHTMTLTPVDSFKPTEEFKDILGYLNTATGEQMKGVGGGIK